MISVAGVTIGTAALIVVLSVMNGFDGLMKMMYNSFEPDLKVTPAVGKVFTLNPEKMDQIKNHPAVFDIAQTLEESALLKYDEQQYIATVKGVSSNFSDITGIDTMIAIGEFTLERENKPYTVVGQGVAYFLSMNINYINPVVIYVPRRDAGISMNPERAFNRDYIFPTGIFSIQHEFDTKYILVPLDYARKLFSYEKELSALEIKLIPDANIQNTQNEISEILSKDFIVKNRYQLHEAFYKIMQSEKFYIYLILTFILIIASFNIIGSLTMLIIDKKEDIATFRSLGANLQTIRRIFLTEGWLITIVGAIIGLIIGWFVCWLQVTFELVRLHGDGSFIIDAYPVEIIWTDFLLIFITVVAIGYFAAWYPVRYITKRFVIQELEES